MSSLEALASPSGVRKPRNRRVDWVELRVIADKVQQALDASGELDDHADYDSVFEMWQAELKDAAKEDEKQTSVDAVASQLADVTVSEAETATLTWYSSANDYWEDAANCPLTDDGVLGGFAHVSPADVRDSNTFIATVHKMRPQWRAGAAVDCGAGIGRVSKMVLLPMFEHVDLVEQSERLLRGARAYIGAESPLLPKVRSLYCMGLQEFHPPAGSYDLVWIQWVSSHLTDSDFVHFLRRCKAALTPNGWIGVKENVLLSGDPYDIDYQDSSITRSEVYYKSLFEQAGLTLIAEKKQKKFPKELFPVKMYALA